MLNLKRATIFLFACLLLILPAFTSADQHGQTLIMARAVDATGLDPHTRKPPSPHLLFSA